MIIKRPLFFSFSISYKLCVTIIPFIRVKWRKIYLKNMKYDTVILILLSREIYLRGCNKQWRDIALREIYLRGYNKKWRDIERAIEFTSRVELALCPHLEENNKFIDFKI